MFVWCVHLRAHLSAHPHKRRHGRWELSQELKGKYATFFAKYAFVEMASRKIQTYQNKAKNLYTVYFVFDLDGECKFIKTKRYSDQRNMFFLAATLVGWIGDFVYRKVAATNIFL